MLNASHELRNPLNALLIRVESLATGLGDEWDDDVEETREEGRRLARILDTLLSLTSRDREGLELAPTDLGDLATSRARAWQAAADAAAIRFDLSGVRSVRCTTDRTIVESALDTVLDNAVKYSSRGSRVELSTSGRQGSGRITVRDHGPGIDAEELSQATSRFWRSQSSLGEPGSGLGLAIATDLMETVGGTISLALPPGGGLSVSLELTGGGAA